MRLRQLMGRVAQLAFIVLAPSLLAGRNASAQSTPIPVSLTPPSYIRDDKNLETAITTFSITSAASSERTTVSLVGVIHVADKEYYQHIQEKLNSYDTVLFELVTDVPIERLPTREIRSNSAIGGIQRQLASQLGLSYQLDEIDYTAARMLRADMTRSELADVMAARNEGFMKLYVKALGMEAKNDAGMSVSDLALLMFPGTRTLQLRRMFAQEFTNLDQLLDAFNGGESIALISARNDVALDTLQGQMAHTDKKRIAIFYGAAHMRDFEKKLVDRFHATKLGTEWLMAWKL